MDLRHIQFVTESNRIEGIHRPPTTSELDAHETLWMLDEITVADLEDFVRDVAARPLRRYPGHNVRVGNHIPPPGGPAIEADLRAILAGVTAGELTPYEAHQRYEHLHPFLDGNGRSGRALWAWHMVADGQDPFALPFLHRWYYQSLDAGRAAGNAAVLPGEQFDALVGSLDDADAAPALARAVARRRRFAPAPESSDG